MRFGNFVIGSGCLLLVLLMGTAGRQPRSSVDTQDLFHRLLNTSSKRIDYYQTVLDCRAIAKELQYDGMFSAAITWSSENPNGSRLMRKLGSEVLGNYAIGTRLAPYLDSSDAKLQKVAEEYFGVVRYSDGVPMENADVASSMIAYGREVIDQPTRRVFEVLFEQDPLYAIRRLATAYHGDRSSLDISVHRIEFAAYYFRIDKNEGEGAELAIEALTKLARNEHWWVRRFVAEMIRRYDAFRTDELLKILRTDPIESVSATVDRPFYAGLSKDEFEAWQKVYPGSTGRY